MVASLEHEVEQTLAVVAETGALPTAEQIEAQLDIIKHNRLDVAGWLRSIATEPKGEVAFAMAVAGMVGGVVLTPFIAIPAAIELARQVYLETRRDK